MKLVIGILAMFISFSVFAANYDVCTIGLGSVSSSDTSHTSAWGINCLDPQMTNLKLAPFDDTSYNYNDRKTALLSEQNRMKVIQYLLTQDFSKLEDSVYVRKTK